MISDRRQNIVFSTTRQWNPGDEIILLGVKNILDMTGVPYNPIIFNRHPDLRFSNFDHQGPSERFYDNSIKAQTACGFLDWAIFAGTPEWCSARTFDLYKHILDNNIPALFLGVGGGCQPFADEFREVIGKAKTIVARDAATLKAITDAQFRSSHLPCPALLSAGQDKERSISQVNRVGLIYQAGEKDSVLGSSLSAAAFKYQKELYHEILRRFSGRLEFEFVCHYVDELPAVTRDFEGIEFRYSYDSADYHDIYRAFDLVVGPRVHGIGAAASVGVPGIAISHDARGSTCEGFLADIVYVDTKIAKVIDLVEAAIASIAERNAKIRDHKAATMATYVDIVRRAMADRVVHYDVKLPSRPVGSPLQEQLDRTEAALTQTKSLSFSLSDEITALNKGLAATHAAFEEVQGMAIDRAREIDRLNARLDRTDAALASAQALAIGRGNDVGKLSKRLDETTAALSQAQALAVERYAEIGKLNDQLDRTNSALDETKMLAAQRGGNIVQLSERLDEINSALDQVQSLAIERHAEIGKLSDQLDRTSAALEEAKAMAIERGKNASELSKRLDETDAALNQVQSLAIERYAEISKLNEQLDRTNSALEETKAMAIDRGRSATELSKRLEETHNALSQAQVLALDRYAEIVKLNERPLSAESNE